MKKVILKVHYIGLLANVNSSILKLKFKYKNKIVTFKPKDEVFKIISKIENIEDRQLFIKLSNFNCGFSYTPYKHSFFYIHNSFKVDCEIDNKGELIFPHQAIFKFHNENYQTYLENSIRKLKLYDEGNVFLPINYYYYKNKKSLKACCFYHNNYIENRPFILANNKKSDINKFIKKVKLPFNNYLNLAFENLELSYQIHDQNLKFITLMICLEILFSPEDRFELRNRISRNIAVLLGRNRNSSLSIYKTTLSLYDKRSKIVHAGARGMIMEKDILILRSYVRESLLKINSINLSKDKLLEHLNLIGFGNFK